MQLHENLQVDVFSTVVPVDANSSHLCARSFFAVSVGLRDAFEPRCECKVGRLAPSFFKCHHTHALKLEVGTRVNLYVFRGSRK